VQVDGKVISKKTVLRKILLYGDQLNLTEKERDFISQSIVFLTDEGRVVEPIVVEALKRVFASKKITSLALVADNGEDI